MRRLTLESKGPTGIKNSRTSRGMRLLSVKGVSGRYPTELSKVQRKPTWLFKVKWETNLAVQGKSENQPGHHGSMGKQPNITHLQTQFQLMKCVHFYGEPTDSYSCR